MSDHDKIMNSIKDMTKAKHPFFVIGVLESTLLHLPSEVRAEVAAHLQELAEGIAKEGVA